MTQPRHFRYAVLNGRLLERSAVAISPFSDGFMFGDGVFETLRVTGGKPEFWAEHAERLTESSQALGLDLGEDATVTLARCHELIAAEAVDEAVLKIVRFRDEQRTSELIMLREIPYGAGHYAAGVLLKVVRGRPGGEALSRHKTQNYLGNLLALRAARAEGYDEIVFADDSGRLLECATANIFVVQNGEILTPPASLGLLPGVIREHLLAHPKLRAQERVLTLDDLATADEVMLTNSVARVLPVRAVGGRVFTTFAVASLCRDALSSVKRAS